MSCCQNRVRRNDVAPCRDRSSLLPRCSAAPALLGFNHRAQSCLRHRRRLRRSCRRPKGVSTAAGVATGKRELRLCDSDRREWFCDFREHRQSFWLLLPSPENSIGYRYRLRWLPGCRRTGSETVAVSVQPLFLRFGKHFRFESPLVTVLLSYAEVVALIAMRLSSVVVCCD
ncbi:uncharacterized protein LOC110266564 [Arachis ipaensis]|uniref:uncharacterized protein LOC110266564 n=1 Tax=Arachis ipaensis TaxID=130454 RepID=UPI000A2B4A1E|nr:uncharacterized protein LOC110266564 [Arachis ipaensis]